jgi:hypothetical protein
LNVFSLLTTECRISPPSVTLINKILELLVLVILNVFLSGDIRMSKVSAIGGGGGGGGVGGSTGTVGAVGAVGIIFGSAPIKTVTSENAEFLHHQ